MRRGTQQVRLVRHVAMSVLVTFLTATMHARTAAAAMIATDTVVQGERTVAAYGKVVSFLERDQVVRELQRLGVDPEEAKLRVAALSPEELTGLSERIDELPAGGNAVGVVVGAIVLVFIILVITDLLGWTSVFPFTEKGALAN